MTSGKDSFPPCGIYLYIPDVSDKPKVLKNLREVAMVINRSQAYEKNMHMVMFDYDPLQVLALRELVEAMRMSGIVSIINGGITGYESTGADGVLLNRIEDILPLRKEIGDDAILGFDARGAVLDIRELSLLAVDYVILPTDLARVSAWSMLTEKPCVASGALELESVADFTAAGASFLDVSNYVFNHKKGVLQGIVNVLDAVENTARNPVVRN